jgi:hypothetical protein
MNSERLRRAEAAVWGPQPASVLAPAPGRLRMRLVAWKPMVKNALRGFATIELPIGLKISDVPVLVSGGKAWARLPGKPQIDREGKQKRDARGRAEYVPILTWRNKKLGDAFSERVVALVLTEHPHALLEDAP